MRRRDTRVSISGDTDVYSSVVSALLLNFYNRDRKPTSI